MKMFSEWLPFVSEYGVIIIYGIVFLRIPIRTHLSVLVWITRAYFTVLGLNKINIQILSFEKVVLLNNELNYFTSVYK